LYISPIDFEYVHLGYGSTYEHYTILEIENGNFKNEQQFEHKDYVEFRDKGKKCQRASLA